MAPRRDPTKALNAALLLVPLDRAHSGSPLAAVSTVCVVTCLATTVVTATAVAGMLYHAQRRIQLVEPDAALIVLLLIASLAAVLCDDPCA